MARPEFVKKGRRGQFFFVNRRYIRHPYFHRAVMAAFESLIAPNEYPEYFIYFEVEPSSIDVNIHPTKTEVKFENEQTLWQILMVTVKESLGKFSAMPSIDFDTADSVDIPVFDPSQKVSPPKVNVNPNYNPFHTHKHEQYSPTKPSFNWEQLYKGFNEQEKEEFSAHSIDATLDFLAPKETEKQHTGENHFPEYYQYKKKAILTSVKSGLMIIDQHRAHIRILFDRYIEQIKNKKGVSQRVLFPETLELSATEAAALPDILDDLLALGFELTSLGKNTFAIQGIPSEIENPDAVKMIRQMIEKRMETGSDVKEEIRESIALSLANLTAIPYGKTLSSEEMLMLVNQLFASPAPNYTPNGQVVISVISDAEMEKKMK